MPAYRAEAFIGRAVTSVIEQSYPHWELLIVSDDGVDYEGLLAEQGIVDERCRFFASPHYASGPNAARNVALASAQGSLIAPLDADDYYYPERLQTLVHLALEHGVAADNVDVCEQRSGNLLYRPFAVQQQIEVLPLSGFLELSTPLILVFKRELIRCGWNEQVILGEDTLFNLRIMEAADTLMLHRWPMHTYSVHEGSICHRPDAASRAETAYSYCLQELSKSGLGFTTARYVEAVTAMLTRKRALNRRFNDALDRGFTGSFQDFIAGGNDLAGNRGEEFRAI